MSLSKRKSFHPYELTENTDRPLRASNRMSAPTKHITKPLACNAASRTRLDMLQNITAAYARGAHKTPTQAPPALLPFDDVQQHLATHTMVHTFRSVVNEERVHKALTILLAPDAPATGGTTASAACQMGPSSDPAPLPTACCSKPAVLDGDGAAWVCSECGEMLMTHVSREKPHRFFSDLEVDPNHWVSETELFDFYEWPEVEELAPYSFGGGPMARVTRAHIERVRARLVAHSRAGLNVPHRMSMAIAAWISVETPDLLTCRRPKTTWSFAPGFPCATCPKGFDTRRDLRFHAKRCRAAR